VFQITISCGNGGSFTVDGETMSGTHDFYTRSDMTLTVNPNKGRAINKTLVAAGEVEMTVDGNTIHLDNILSNVTLNITFRSTESSSSSDTDSSQENNGSTTTTTPTTLPTLSGNVTTTVPTTDIEQTTPDINTDSVIESTSTDNVNSITNNNTETIAGSISDDTNTTAENVLTDETIIVDNGAAIINENQALSRIEETLDQTVMNFQLRDLEENVNAVEIPTTSLKELESRHGEVNIVLTNFEVRFDKKATTAIVSQANGETIYICVEPIELEALEEQQVVSVEDKVVLISFSASVISGGINISDFWEGQATIMIPFEPEENVDIDEYAVVYIPKNGEIEVMDSRYEDGCMVFSINHFSEYAIVRDATLKDATNKADTLEDNITNDTTPLPSQTTTTSANRSWIWITITTLIALLAILLLIIIKRRKNEQQ
jgi:hypothetical protein